MTRRNLQDHGPEPLKPPKRVLIVRNCAIITPKYIWNSATLDVFKI